MCAVSDDPKMVKTQFAPKGIGNERIWGRGVRNTDSWLDLGVAGFHEIWAAESE